MRSAVLMHNDYADLSVTFPVQTTYSFIRVGITTGLA